MKNKFSKFCMRLAIFLAVFVIVLAPLDLTYADTLTDLQNQLKVLMNQKKQNTQAITAKQQQINDLKQQIDYVAGQINTTTSAISSTDSEITKTTQNVADLQTQIDKAQADIDAEQALMSKIIASWYTEGESGLLQLVLGSDNISEAITKEQYFDSVRQQVEVEIDKINTLKTDLATQKSQMDQKLTELSDLKNSQVDQKNYLQSRKTMKDRLLTDTASAVTDLQSEQAKADALISDLSSRITKIQKASVGTAGDLVSGVPESWYYQQGYGGGQPWSDYKMGYYATIGSYGCLLTSLTMIADYYGAHYTPATAADNSSFVHTWGSSDGALISTSIVNDSGSRRIDWNVVDSELASGHPVVLGVSLNGVDMGNSYGVSHFVVVTDKLSNGKYVMQDPLGTNRGYNKSWVQAMRIIRSN
ncbi:MAG: C39 family peptidase [Candidatus Berkelbacteria bacterium]|nr:C39 family peptidase [Candidatus Berkelbacteria bacterium]